MGDVSGRHSIICDALRGVAERGAKGRGGTGCRVCISVRGLASGAERDCNINPLRRVCVLPRWAARADSGGWVGVLFDASLRYLEVTG